MKFLVVLFAVCAISFVKGQPLTKEEKIQKLTAVAKACQAQESATDADIQEAVNRLPPTTETSKCLRACMFEAFGSLANGEIVVENIAAFVSKSVSDPAIVTAVTEVSTECKPASAGLPRCELIAKFLECSVQGLQARGYDPQKHDV